MTNEKESINLIKEMAAPFQAETQDLIVNLHNLLVDFGFKYELKNKRFSTVGNYLLYSYKPKSIEDVWIIKINPDDCAIRFNSKYVDNYITEVEEFPSSLLDIITNGDGCVYDPTPQKCQIGYEDNKFTSTFSLGGKQYIKCNSKCCKACDFWKPLSNITNEMSQAITQWIELELQNLTPVSTAYKQ